MQNCRELIAAVWKASAFGHLPVALTLGKDFRFDSTADGEPVIGYQRDIQTSRFSVQPGLCAAGATHGIETCRGVTLSYSVGPPNLPTKPSPSPTQPLVFLPHGFLP